MADKKYLGLGVIFKAIDQDFTKTSKQVQGSLSSTSNQLDKVQNTIDNMTFDGLNDLFSTLKIFESSIGTEDRLGYLQKGLYNLEDQLVNFTNTSNQAAANKNLQNYLVALKDNGRITEEQFVSLSRAAGDISELNFPLPNVDTLNELSQFMEEQRQFIPRMSSGLDGWSTSTLGLENAIDKVNRAFDAQKKVKSINKYKVELQNLHNQGKISSKDFQKISGDLNKLSEAFIKKARDPESYFSKIYKGAKYASAPIRELGSKIFDLGKTVIANLPNISEGLIGKGEVSQLGSDLDFLNTKMSLVMDSDQANKFNNSLMGVMRTTGMTADQAGNLSNAMNRYGVSVKDSTELMPFLGDLVGKMGIDGQQVAEMGGQLTRNLGMSVNEAKDMTKQFYKMGKARGFVDFLEDMPEIVSSTTNSMNRLGLTNSKTAKESIKSSAALTGMYRKLGIEQKTAVMAVTKMQGALTDMRQDIVRLGVGLEPENFDAMIDVAGEITRLTGKSADEAFQMIQDGATDTNGFLLKMMDIAEKTTNPKDIQRMGEIVRKTFGDEAANLITNVDLRKRALDSGIDAAKEEAKLKEKGGDVLSEDQKILKGTFKVTQDLLKTNQQLMQAMAEMKGKDAILKSWNDQMSVWQDKQDAINQGTLQGQILIGAFVQQAAGLAGLANLAGLDNLGKGLATAGTNARALEESLRAISGLTAGISGFAAIFSSLAFGTLPAIIKLIGKMIPGMDKLKNIFGKFGGGKNIGEGLSESFSNLSSKIKTIPMSFSKLAKFGKLAAKGLGPIGTALGFVNDATDAVREKTLGQGIATFLFGKKEEIKSTGDAIKTVGTQALKWGALGATVGSVIPGIGTAIGGAIGAAFGTISSVIQQDFGPKIMEWMGYWTSKLYLSAKESFSGLWDSFKNTGSTALSFIKDKASSIWDTIANSAAKVWDRTKSLFSFEGAKQGVKDFFDWIVATAKTLPEKIMSAFTTIPGWMKNLFGGLTSGFEKGAQQAQIEHNLKKNDGYVDTADTAMISPILNQSEAPTLSRVPTSTPRMNLEKEKGNTLDDVVKTLVEVRNSFVDEIKNISNKPIYVMLQGDAKKFFKAVATENADAMGTRGLQNQAVFGG